MGSTTEQDDRASILLVDDRPENLLAFEALLQPLGHRLVSVQSGEAAVEAAKNENFALVLLDFHMPGMDGIEAAASIKAQDRSRTTPIIFVTADGTLPGNLTAYEAGGVDILVKPFDIDALRAKVAVFAELWRLRRREVRREREQIERRAQETERQNFEALLMQAPVAIAMWSGADHRFTFANERFRLILPGERVPDQPLREAFPEFSATMATLFDKVYSSGEPFVSHEYRADYDRDGSGTPKEAYFTFNLSALRRGADEVYGVMAVATEITEVVLARREAAAHAEREAALLKRVSASEARFRRLHESGVIGVVFWNRAGAILDANDAFLEMVGRARSEIASGALRWREMTPEEFLPLDERAFEEMAGRGFCQPYEKEFLHRDGHRVPILLGMAYWEGSTDEGVAWILDISAKKKEEQRRDLLAKASRVFAGSIELATTLRGVAGLFVPDVADWANVYLFRDDGTPELAACVHVDAAKETIVRQVHDRMPEAVRALTKTMSAGEFDLFREVDDALLEKLASGDAEWLRCARILACVSSLTVPMISHGRTIGMIGLMSARPSRRFSEEDAPLVEEIARRAATAIDNARLFEMAQEERRRADEANRTKDEFLAVVSHELRTPLNAMLGWANLLAKGGLGSEQTRKAIDTIERNAKAQARLIEDLLDVSRIITGKLKLELEEFDLLRVIDAAVEVVRPAAEARRVELVAPSERNPSTMVGDPSRLQQAVWNLLSNAVKFTPAGGKVTVRVARVDSSYAITVDDTGAGIPPAFLPFVFDRFRQAEMSSSRQHGGLGLGLSIVRHIAELHGGSVHASSHGAGKGSTFTLKVPIAPAKRRSTAPLARDPDADVAIAPPSYSARGGLSGLKILVVDDEVDARELLAHMLELHRASVLTAGSAEEALRIFKERRPDVLISDIAMPGEDGYSLIGRIRALPLEEGGRTPAIALTAYARTADRTRALLSGFTMHVPKPVDPVELLAVVETITERRRSSPDG